MANKSLSINNLRREREDHNARLAASKSFIVRRPFTVRGRLYAAGNQFKPPTGIDFGKVSQLVDQRFLQAPPLGKLEASKRFTIAGRSYAPGDRFSTEGLKIEKVTQLLEHRFIQPATPAA